MLAAAVAATGRAPDARADQTDPRLEALFTHLKAASHPLAAREIEIDIWHIWADSDDGAVRALMQQGLLAMDQGDLRRALDKFDQIVHIAPNFAEGWNRRATVNYLLGNYTKSLSDIEKTLMLEPRHFGALSGRGLVYMALGKEELALDSFEAALKVYPLMPGASRNAKELRKRLHRRDI
jgi:tetratricopeptide (TPR) repeat protein